MNLINLMNIIIQKLDKFIYRYPNHYKIVSQSVNSPLLINPIFYTNIIS